jgi:tetratricopeptide (TPR) repeat protein
VVAAGRLEAEADIWVGNGTCGNPIVLLVTRVALAGFSSLPARDTFRSISVTLNRKKDRQPALHTMCMCCKSIIDRLWSAAEQYPRRATAWFMLGIALNEAGDLVGSAASFRRAIKLEPSDASAHFELGAILFKLNDFKASASSFARAVDICPRIEEYQYSLGSALRAAGDPVAAEKAYRSASALHPFDSSNHIQIGQIRMEAGSLREAEECFRLALSIAPGDIMALGSLAYVLETTVQLTEAAQCYEEILIQDPNDYRARLGLGRIKISTGLRREGVSMIRKVARDSTEPLKTQASEFLRGLKQRRL